MSEQEEMLIKKADRTSEKLSNYGTLVEDIDSITKMVLTGTKFKIETEDGLFIIDKSEKEDLKDMQLFLTGIVGRKQIEKTELEKLIAKLN